MSVPEMSPKDLAALGLTTWADDTRRWRRSAFGCLYCKPEPGAKKRLQPARTYPGDHTYRDTVTGREVTVFVTHARHWQMPCSVDDVQLLYSLDGVVAKLFYYHGIAHNNGDGTWSCAYCGFTSTSPDEILNAEEGCTVGKPPCSYCGGGRECALDCPGIAKALSGEDVYMAGSLAPTEYKA